MAKDFKRLIERVRFFRLILKFPDKGKLRVINSLRIHHYTEAYKDFYGTPKGDLKVRENLRELENTMDTDEYVGICPTDL